MRATRAGGEAGLRAGAVSGGDLRARGRGVGELGGVGEGDGVCAALDAAGGHDGGPEVAEGAGQLPPGPGLGSVDGEAQHALVEVQHDSHLVAVGEAWELHRGPAHLLANYVVPSIAQRVGESGAEEVPNLIYRVTAAEGLVERQCWYSNSNINVAVSHASNAEFELMLAGNKLLCPERHPKFCRVLDFSHRRTGDTKRRMRIRPPSLKSVIGLNFWRTKA